MVKFKRYFFVGVFVLALIFLTNHNSHINDYFNDEYEILINNRIMSNVSVEKYPAFLNYNPQSNYLKIHSNYLFNYFLKFDYVNFDGLKDGDLVIVDLRRGLANADINENEVVYHLGNELYLITVRKHQVTPETPIIRSVDVFQKEVVDSREFWSNVSLWCKCLSVFKLTEEEANAHLHILKIFNNFKENQLINLNIDKGPKDSKKNFRIFQISDLHLWHGKLDSITEMFLVNAVNSQLPNLIIINGDLLEFNKANVSPETSAADKAITEDDLSTVLFGCLDLFIKFKIPYIINFGESDHQSPNSSRLLKFISNLPYCLNSYNPDENLNGLTNYNFKLYLNNEIIGMISILDTYNNQITSNQVNSIYKFNSLNNIENIFKLAFIHYPLPNFRPIGKFKIVGDYKKMDELVTDTDKSVLNDFINLNYNVISASHEHENDGCILHNNNGNQDSDNAKDIDNLNNEMWLCYSSVAGATAKADGDIDRKLRVFEISGDRLLSWKVSEKTGKAFHYQLIHQLK